MKALRILAISLGALAISGSSLYSSTLVVLPGSAGPYLTTSTGFPPAESAGEANGGTGVANVGGAALQSANPNTQLFNAVFVFQLPSLGAVSNPFTDASFTATIASSNGGSAFSFNPGGNNYDLYALGARSSSTVLATDFYKGTADLTDATLLFGQFAGVDYGYTTYGAGTAKTTGSSTPLITYLNASYANGVGAGNYVFLRINPNFNPNSFSDLSWNTDSTTFLTYTAVPEPKGWILLLSGVLFLVLLRRHLFRFN